MFIVPITFTGLRCTVPILVTACTAVTARAPRDIGRRVAGTVRVAVMGMASAESDLNRRADRKPGTLTYSQMSC